MKNRIFYIIVFAMFSCFAVNAQSSLVEAESASVPAKERTEISPDQLPAAVKAVLESDMYKGWSVAKAFVVKETTEYYEVVLKSETEETTIKLDAGGNVLN